MSFCILFCPVRFHISPEYSELFADNGIIVHHILPRVRSDTRHLCVCDVSPWHIRAKAFNNLVVGHAFNLSTTLYVAELTACSTYSEVSTFRHKFYLASPETPPCCSNCRRSSCLWCQFWWWQHVLAYIHIPSWSHLHLANLPPKERIFSETLTHTYMWCCLLSWFLLSVWGLRSRRLIILIESENNRWVVYMKYPFVLTQIRSTRTYVTSCAYRIHKSSCNCGGHAANRWGTVIVPSWTLICSSAMLRLLKV